MTTKHSAIYVRVSSKQQDHASQMPDLERWVAAHGGAVNWYRDKFTGKTLDRPGMEKLLTDLRAGKVERIVVWRLDRLGRTTRGLCQLFDELGERKVDLVSLKDGFSLASPAGRLHARILASVAEYETEVRAERVAAGQAVARKKGKKWGGSKKGWLMRTTLCETGSPTLEETETPPPHTQPGPRYPAPGPGLRRLRRGPGGARSSQSEWETAPR